MEKNAGYVDVKKTKRKDENFQRESLKKKAIKLRGHHLFPDKQ